MDLETSNTYTRLCADKMTSNNSIPKIPESVYYWDNDNGHEDGYIEFSARATSKAPAPGIMKTSFEEEEMEGSPDSKEPERGGWSSKWDFLFSCISVSVGLGNVWRFPYLCYKNGGGAFLVTYGIAMVCCGIPIFFQEVAIGQYLGAGGMTLVGTLCPLLHGVGYATMTIVFFLDVYYCIIIAWTLFYLINTFTMLPGLPWENCGNWWNTENCFKGSENHTHQLLPHNETANHTTPVEEYWERRVLRITEGMENLGGMQWELVGCLFLGWILVYFIIWKGLSQSGKIIWFTALFPYAIMFVLLIRGLTLDGAMDGLRYFITPDWSYLRNASAWIDGATQIFFGYSVGTGALPALGSYNDFHHNCYRDAIITCIVNTLTCLLAGSITFSILGYIAFTQSTSVANVVKSGPGLVFLTYPEVVLKLPGAVAWAIIFFVMLAILGIDSEFCNVESFVTGMVDNWPTVLRANRKKFTLGVCVIMFLLGLPMVSEGGAYVFQLMDFYSASGMSLLWVIFFQTISISWIFGASKFCDCIFQMTGKRPGLFWSVCWVCLAPIVMLGIFIFYCIQYEPVKYGKSYEYPAWAEVMGILMSVTSMIWVPVYAIYYILTTPGSIRENIRNGFTPTISKTRGVRPPIAEGTGAIPLSESKVGLIYTGHH